MSRRCRLRGADRIRCRKAVDQPRLELGMKFVIQPLRLLGIIRKLVMRGRIKALSCLLRNHGRLLHRSFQRGRLGSCSERFHLPVSRRPRFPRQFFGIVFDTGQTEEPEWISTEGGEIRPSPSRPTQRIGPEIVKAGHQPVGRFGFGAVRGDRTGADGEDCSRGPTMKVAPGGRRQLWGARLGQAGVRSVSGD